MLPPSSRRPPPRLSLECYILARFLIAVGCATKTWKTEILRIVTGKMSAMQAMMPLSFSRNNAVSERDCICTIIARTANISRVQPKTLEPWNSIFFLWIFPVLFGFVAPERKIFDYRCERPRS